MWATALVATGIAFWPAAKSLDTNGSLGAMIVCYAFMYALAAAGVGSLFSRSSVGIYVGLATGGVIGMLHALIVFYGE